MTRNENLPELSPRDIANESSRALEKALQEVLGSERGRIRLVGRSDFAYRSTFPLEVVYVETASGERLQILCKYEGEEEPHTRHANRGGVRYESQVYGCVLQSLGLALPVYHGYHDGTLTGAPFIAIEYLVDADRLVRSIPLDGAMAAAAAWIGRMHRACEERVGAADHAFLLRYSSDFFRGWAERSAQYAADAGFTEQWFFDLCDAAHPALSELGCCAPTVIHGEYYPMNIMMRGDEVLPVDWESAAVAPGEIDLACITEGWTEDIVTVCRRAYEEARWPAGTPPEHHRLRSLAELYLPFRWLGDRADWTREIVHSPRIRELRGLGERLGIL